MRKLLTLSVTAILLVSLSSCSSSGTGPDPDNGNGDETPTTYDVSVSKSNTDAGSVTPADTTVDEGEQVELQANPNDEYLFTHWSGDIDSTADNPLSLSVDRDYNITANFELKSYDLTVNTTGEGAINETVVQQPSKEYEHGTVVELTANPAKGWQFVEWTGDLTGTGNPSQITVDTTKSVTAIFEKKTYTLDLLINGEGSINKNPNQSEYEFGSNVDLTANPTEGWKFVEWSGDIQRTENPTNVFVDTTKSITALFEKKSYSLNLDTQGDGTITKSPDQNQYKHGTTVDLTANASEGWKFIEWSGDISRTENPTQVLMDGGKSISAIFERKNGVHVSVNWSDLGNVPQEIFSGSQSNGKSTSGTDKDVTHFGVRIEFVSSDTSLSQSIENTTESKEAYTFFNDIPATDSVAIYAIAVNQSHAVKLGAIKSTYLDASTVNNFTSQDFEWFAPSWGTGPDFEETGWDTARVSKSVDKADIEFDVVNPYDGADRTSDYIMRLNGVGGFENYKGNNIREYRNVVEHPNPGTVDTVRTWYEWHPYIDETKFSLPNSRYIVDLRSSFVVIFE